MKKNNSNKSFGIVFFLVFLLIAFFPLIDGGTIRVWSLVISIIFLILGLINSKLLTPLNLAWIKFGELLGKVIAPIVMGIIYFFVITPIGLFMRILGKDLLNTKLSSNRSYWIKREKNIGSMKRQF
tara:strand:- start:2043 stop:2420 length:378 start_codon:yes stop_codon:yes gene_type:complete